MVDKLSVQSLSGFMECVQRLRDNWPRHEHKELWFRGESLAHQREGTFLHPVLYRPRKTTPRKPIDDLLRKEAELYDDFMRCAVQISDGRAEGEDWDWDAYFLMRHHSAPTRLLDWSDGALIALHFAVQRHEDDDQTDAVVYVLEPDLLKKQLEALPETIENKVVWKKYVAKHKTHALDEDDDARSYLPAEDDDERIELPLPIPPMVLDFPHITRRVAAQRSRFIVFGSDPDWLTSHFGKSDDFPIKAIIIDGKYKEKIRPQLRDSGVTESVIFPDLDGLGREMLQVFWEWK
jgi:hypothetical protein